MGTSFCYQNNCRLELQYKSFSLGTISARMDMKLMLPIVFILIPGLCSALECYRSSPGAGYNFQKTLQCEPGQKCMAWRYEVQRVGDSMGARCVEWHVGSMCGKRVISSRGNNLVYSVCCCEGDKCNNRQYAENCHNTDDMYV